MNIAQGPAAQHKMLGFHIDVYECAGCGARFVTTADHLTFKNPPPMECERCGAWDMVARRFVDGTLQPHELSSIDERCWRCEAEPGHPCTVIAGGPDGDPRLNGGKAGEVRAVPHWGR